MSNQTSAAAKDEQPPFESADAGALLRGSDALAPREAGQVLARAQGRVVVWVGERGTGKTTLNCELYERQRRPKSDSRFAGSQTLLAFEQRAHSSRAASGRTVPETQRTEQDLERRDLLHLALGRDKASIVHLFLSDLPGEVFTQLRDNTISVDDVPLLGRADKLALIADGRRLADVQARPLVVSGLRQLLARLCQGGLPHPATELALIVTMWDLVCGDAAAEGYWRAREADLHENVRAVDPGAPLLKVAARARSDWRQDDGMTHLRSWLLEAGSAVPDPALSVPDWPESAPPLLRQPKWVSHESRAPR
ncbi:MAG: hypothetical protein WKF33_02425 [Thermoleophilaceae bacterium]